MTGFLHSLPWTIALALAQAGESGLGEDGGPLALPLEARSLFVAEDRNVPDDGPDFSLRAPDSDEEPERSGFSPAPSA